MRIWLDPPKLKSRDLTTEDVLAAIREQNVQVAAGQIGQPPAPPGQSFQYTVNVLGRLTDIEQFEDIIIKTGEGGRITRLKDIARIELGGKSYDITSSLTGKPSASVLIYQLPGANALDVAGQIYATMEDLSTIFPKAWNTRFPMTPPSSSNNRSRRSLSPCSRRQAWCFWCCSSFCRTGGPP